MGNGISNPQYPTQEAALADGKSQAEIDAFLKGPSDEYCWNGTQDAQGASNQFYQYPNSLTAKEKSAELKKPYPAYGQGFPDKDDQDVIPPVTWLQVPVTSGLPEGTAELAKHAELDKIVTDYLTKWKLPGGCNLALVSTTKGVLYNKGFGVRSITDTQLAPLTPDCLMYCGSVSKTITSVAIMCLVEDGALTLDQPILALICKKSLHDGCAGLERSSCGQHHGENVHEPHRWFFGQQHGHRSDQHSQL